MKIDPRLAEVVSAAKRDRDARQRKLADLNAQCADLDAERAPIERRLEILAGTVGDQVHQLQQRRMRAHDDQQTQSKYARELELNAHRRGTSDNANVAKANDAAEHARRQFDQFEKKIAALRAEIDEVDDAIRSSLEAEKAKALEAAMNGDLSVDMKTLTVESFRARYRSVLEMALGKIKSNGAYAERDRLQSRKDEVLAAVHGWVLDELNSGACFAPVRDLLRLVEATVAEQGHPFPTARFHSSRVLTIDVPLSRLFAPADFDDVIDACSSEASTHEATV